MSEYYLADRKAEERQRQRDAKRDTNAESQNVKVTLLGDFLFPAAESNGCDPYNSTQGKSAREVWTTRRDRR